MNQITFEWFHEEIVIAISKEGRTEWMTVWRLESFKIWKKWLSGMGKMFTIKNLFYKPSPIIPPLIKKPKYDFG